MSASATDSYLDILRRIDPADAEKNVSHLSKFVSREVIDVLYQSIGLPLKVCADCNAKDRKFLTCSHNRDGSSFRSPWSNTYTPPLEDGFRPSQRLRKLELNFNEIFDIYRDLYYGRNASISSVYLWDKNGGEGPFGGCFLIQKNIEGDDELTGFWNSIHLVDVDPSEKETCKYMIKSTIMISLKPALQSTTVNGSLGRENSRECSFHNENDHIINLGKLIEDVEGEMRSEIESLYIHKTRSIVEKMREEGQRATEGQEHTKVLNEAVLARALRSRMQVE